MINDPISALPCIFSMHSCGPHSDQVCPSKLFEVPANRLQTPFKKKKKKKDNYWILWVVELGKTLMTFQRAVYDKFLIICRLL